MTATVQPGGAAYLEFKLPGTGGGYDVYLSPSDGSKLHVTLVPLGVYPALCAADRAVDLETELWVTLHLPDDCTAVTVVVTHIDPFEEDPESIWVGIEPRPVTDDFERTLGSGWGTAVTGWPWRARSATAGTETVDGHAGVLPLTAGAVNGQRVPLWSDVTHFLAVAEFSSCDPDDDVAMFDVGAPVYLTSGGMLHGWGAAPVSLTGLDPCAPWYLRSSAVGDEYEIRVWQATAPEPGSPQLTLDAGTGPAQLAIGTVGVDASPARSLRIQWLDVELEPTGAP